MRLSSIVVTLASSLSFFACDAELGTSRRAEVEAAPLDAGEGSWTLHLAIDGGEVQRAPGVALAMSLDLAALPNGERADAVFYAEDAESGEKLGTSTETSYGGRPAVERVRLHISDPCADAARCTRAIRFGVRLASPREVTVQPSFEATSAADELVIAAE